MPNAGPPRGFARLGQLGFIADLSQKRAIVDLLQTEGAWSPGEIASAMATILARSERQKQRLREEIERLLVASPEPVVEAASASEPPAAAIASLTPGVKDTAAEVRIRLTDSVRARRRLVSVVMVVSGILLLTGGAAILLGGSITLPFMDGLPLEFRADLPIWLAAIALVLPIGFFLSWLADSLPGVLRWRTEEKERRRQLRIMLPPGPVSFRIDGVGGKRPRRFDRREMLSVARGVPRFIGTTDSAVLDGGQTVVATTRAAGEIKLIYAKYREVRPVVVLAGRASLARSWSRFGEELVEDLRSAGVEAALGFYSPGLRETEWADGRPLDLWSLVRTDALVLLVGDRRALMAPAHDDATLGSDRLARMKDQLRRLAGNGDRVAFIDEREVRFWDRRSDPALGIPGLGVYPATEGGVIAAFRRLGGERVAAPRLPLRAISAGTDPSAAELERFQADW